jgi:hypothetical protein
MMWIAPNCITSFRIYEPMMRPPRPYDPLAAIELLACKKALLRGIYDEQSMLQTPHGGGRNSSGDGSAAGGGRDLAIRAEDQATTAAQLRHLRESKGPR